MLAAQHGKEILQRDRCGRGALTGVMAVHQVRKRQAQCVGQRFQRIDVRQTDAAFPAAVRRAAVRPARPGSGPAPCAPGQERHRTFLRPYRSHPFPQNSRLVWKTQPTERLPTLLKENERASCKNILTKSYDDTILKAKEGRWLQIGQLLTGIMSKRLTARLGNRGGQSFLLLE